jgi:hypothetical protein
MGLKITTVELDELTADPGSPVEGEVWYNTTDQKARIYLNGATRDLIHDVTFVAHTGDTSNSHQVTLEQARSQDNQVSGDINMNSNKLIGLVAPSAAGDSAEFQWVLDQINSKLGGLDWQESVIDKDLVTAPGSPVTGDRYIIAGIGGGWSGGTIDDIAEWDGSAWVFTTPNEGFATRVMDENKVYIHDGTSWGLFEATLDHGALLGLADDDHTIYLLVDGSRAMTGNLDMGGNAITNVGNVDGVDVSAHAARHIDGGADAIDGDKVEISWVPTNYTRDASPAEVDALDQLTAHLKGIDDAITAGGLGTKSGKVLAGTFTGSPKKATVTFSAAFADANYSVSLTPETSGNRTFSPSVESVVAGSFVIMLASGSIANLTAVHWTAIKHGET